jgi:hypothetical protein
MKYPLSKIKEHLSDSGRKLADLTASMVYEDPTLIQPLLEVSWSDEYPWCQRASRVLWICSLQDPQLLQPHVSKIINRMGLQKSESVRRNFLKLFYDTDFKLSERDHSLLLDLCYDYLNGPFSIAVRVYSMDVLYKLTREIPEIQRELYAIIENELPESSAGYKSHGIKIMKKIERNLR